MAISSLFNGLPNEFEVGRYHSWVVSEDNFPDVLEITARDDNNYIMALQHKKFDVKGVQFHPEAILTQGGSQLLGNFLRLAGLAVDADLAPGDEIPQHHELPYQPPHRPVTF